MGFCREEIGRISIETRRESFYIHYEPENPALAKFWREVPHPELAYEDLPDLIRALTEMHRDRQQEAPPKCSRCGTYCFPLGLCLECRKEAPQP